MLLANEKTEVTTPALIWLLENGFDWMVRDENENTFEENINQAPYLSVKQIDMIQESSFCHIDYSFVDYNL